MLSVPCPSLGGYCVASQKTVSREQEEGDEADGEAAPPLPPLSRRVLSPPLRPATSFRRRLGEPFPALAAACRSQKLAGTPPAPSAPPASLPRPSCRAGTGVRSAGLWTSGFRAWQREICFLKSARKNSFKKCQKKFRCEPCQQVKPGPPACGPKKQAAAMESLEFIRPVEPRGRTGLDRLSRSLFVTSHRRHIGD